MWKLKFYWSLVLACSWFICAYLRGFSLVCIVWKQWLDSKSVKVSKITACKAPQRWVGGIIGSWECFGFLLSLWWVHNSFSGRLYKRQIVSGRSGLSTYSFLAEASRQPSLNHGSPLWQRACTAAFTLTSNQISVLSIMGLLPLGRLCMYKKTSLGQPLPSYSMDSLPPSLCVCLCAYRLIELEGAPSPMGAFHLVLYVFWQS